MTSGHLRHCVSAKGSKDKNSLTSLQDVVEALQDLSHKYDQEVQDRNATCVPHPRMVHRAGSTRIAQLHFQELRATVAKLTAENRKLMRRTSDSDGSSAVALPAGPQCTKATRVNTNMLKVRPQQTRGLRLGHRPPFRTATRQSQPQK